MLRSVCVFVYNKAEQCVCVCVCVFVYNQADQYVCVCVFCMCEEVGRCGFHHCSLIVLCVFLQPQPITEAFTGWWWWFLCVDWGCWACCFTGSSNWTWCCSIAPTVADCTSAAVSVCE